MCKVKSVLLLLCVILLTSCLGQESGKQAKQQEPAAQRAQPQSPAPAQPAPAAAETPAAVPALAVAEGEVPGVKAEIHELKRTGGDTLTLKFSIANGSAKELNFGYHFAEKGRDVPDYNTVGGVHLIDAEGKKKYFVVRDAEGQCACSRDLRDVNPGSRSQLWAKFPAPPDNVQKISIVVPHFLPVEDVPISR
jgi:uncharacterized iron-regulated membrane protein